VKHLEAKEGVKWCTGIQMLLAGFASKKYEICEVEVDSLESWMLWLASEKYSQRYSRSSGDCIAYHLRRLEANLIRDRAPDFSERAILLVDSSPEKYEILKFVVRSAANGMLPFAYEICIASRKAFMVGFQPVVGAIWRPR
jgi:hypothetical protein